MIPEESEHILVKSFDEKCQLSRPGPDTDTETEHEFSCSTPTNVGSKSCSHIGDTPSQKQSAHHISSSTSQVNNSLVEFERYEQMATHGHDQSFTDESHQLEQNNESLNMSQSTQYQPMFQAPIHHMEDLLFNLRSNYNKVPGQQQPIKSEEYLFEAKEPLNSSFNFQNMASKILPMTGPIFAASNTSPATKAPEAATNYSYSRAGDNLVALESRLENETLRRQHCEKQIHELNEHLLELQQQLAIASSLDKKRDMFVQNMDTSLQKILDSWKQREVRAERSLEEARLERQGLVASEQKSAMRLQLLEGELRVTQESLIGERVRAQELGKEVDTLKSALNDALESYIDRKNEVERQRGELEVLRTQAEQSRVEMAGLRREMKEKDEEARRDKENGALEVEGLQAKNKLLTDKNEKIATDYESLITETRSMLAESEAQYGELARKLDKERMSKDSLQLEVNVLEERLDLQAKQLDRECEARLARMHAAALDQEKALQEEHKRELEETQQKGRAEIAALRQRQHAEVQRKTGEYETSLTELNLQLDSQRSETERLKRANVDLETDRNQIRQSLKQMLELQMKEALTLLGINKSNIDTNLQSISSFTANKRQESQGQQAIEDIDPKLAMLNYDQSIDQLIGQVQLNAKQDLQLPADPTGPEPIAAPLDQTQNANPIINYAKSINETIDSIMREHQSIAVSTSVAGSVKAGQQAINTNSSAIKEPIRDSYILSQIELINQYYQIDGKKLAADLSQSNFMELGTANNKQQSMNKSLSTSASLSSSSSNLSSSENLVAREPAKVAVTSPIRSSPKTPEGQAMRPVNRVKTPLPPGKLQSKRIEDEILDRSILELNANQQQHNSSTATTSTRANDLRNFIEMLLVRSPSKQSSECELQKPVETRSYSESINPSRLHVTSSSHTAQANNQPLQKQQGLRNYQGQHSKSQPMFPEVDLDATDLDHSNSENDTEIDNGQRGGKTKHFSYHDISDIDLGYTKRQSSEYYDDVKRTLNFDDETDQTEDETDQGTLTKTANYNTTSTPSKQRVAKSGTLRHASTATNFAKKTCLSGNTNSNKQQTANTSSRNNGAQQVPLSCGGSKSNKIRFLKKTKSSSGSNNSQSSQSGALSSRQLANCSTISSLSNLNSTKSHSMISLVGFCSASNLPDNLNRNSKNVKQRVWK